MTKYYALLNTIRTINDITKCPRTLHCLANRRITDITEQLNSHQTASARNELPTGIVRRTRMRRSRDDINLCVLVTRLRPNKVNAAYCHQSSSAAYLCIGRAGEPTPNTAESSIHPTNGGSKCASALCNPVPRSLPATRKSSIPEYPTLSQKGRESLVW